VVEFANRTGRRSVGNRVVAPLEGGVGDHEHWALARLGSQSLIDAGKEVLGCDQVAEADVPATSGRYGDGGGHL